jgi:hypothetical protein
MGKMKIFDTGSGSTLWKVLNKWTYNPTNWGVSMKLWSERVNPFDKR